jgi:hypothetical protein
VERGRLENLEFKANLDYMVRPCRKKGREKGKKAERRKEDNKHWRKRREMESLYVASRNVEWGHGKQNGCDYSPELNIQLAYDPAMLVHPGS